MKTLGLPSGSGPSFIAKQCWILEAGKSKSPPSSIIDLKQSFRYETPPGLIQVEMMMIAFSSTGGFIRQSGLLLLVIFRISRPVTTVTLFLISVTRLTGMS